LCDGAVLTGANLHRTIGLAALAKADTAGARPTDEALAKAEDFRPAAPED
jgi:hypothetical protein